MIDGSEKRKRQLAFELHNSQVCAVSASFEFRFQTHLTDNLHVSDVKTGRRELGRIYAQLNQK